MMYLVKIIDTDYGYHQTKTNTSSSDIVVFSISISNHNIYHFEDYEVTSCCLKISRWLSPLLNCNHSVHFYKEDNLNSL